MMDDLATTHFFTVDAETCYIPSGVDVIHQIREEIEREYRLKVPISWLMKYQQDDESALPGEHSEDDIQEPDDLFDGYALAKDRLLAFQERGDEIGWHYHAYIYVNHLELGHDTLIRIVEQDMLRFGRARLRQHPEFDVRAFRFGWFFIPDYELYRALYRTGIRADASSKKQGGERVSIYDARHLPSLPDLPRDLHGVRLFPDRNVLLIHDWNVVPHELTWHAQDEAETERARERLRGKLREMAEAVLRDGGRFATFRTAMEPASPESLRGRP